MRLQEIIKYGKDQLKNNKIDDETIKANFKSHYYITAIFYNPLTKEIILHECD